LKILLAGPFETQALGDAIGIDLSGLPRGSVQTPLAPLSSGLLAQGHRLHLLTLDADIDDVQDYSFGRVRLSFCPLRAAPRYRARVRSRDLFAKEIAYLTEVMRTSDAEIVNAHWTYEYAEAAIRSSKPALITMRDLGWDYLFLFGDLYRLMRLVMKYRVMLRARHVSAVSAFAAAKAWQYGYVGKVDVIPNPISAAAAPEKTLERPVIVTVGNAGRVKNVAASVAAFAVIRAALPTAELHLFGPGLEPGGPFDKAESGIVCHGHVAHGELMRFLEKAAHLLVHPARIETFGTILAEAKTRGVPVIGGKNSGGVAYVVGEAGGMLVDIERAEEIAEAAIGMLTNQNDYAALQKAAHEDIAERFSVERISCHYLQAYQRILENGTSTMAQP